MSRKPRRLQQLRIRWVLGLSGSLVLANMAMASNEQTTAMTSTPPQSSNPTLSEKSLAEHWGLSKEDWQRYRSLLQGVRGSISPSNLSPIEVLGIHARDAQERQKYAEQWAMIMREDAERILAFQQAYDEAQRRLFPNESLIDAMKLARFSARVKAVKNTLSKPLSYTPLDTQDRVLFFTPQDCPRCDALLERLLGKLTQINGVDVYLLDVANGEEAVIRQWAQHRQIDPDWVQTQRVTLNRDAGALKQLSGVIGEGTAKGGKESFPVMLRRRGEAISPLSIYQF